MIGRPTINIHAKGLKKVNDYIAKMGKYLREPKAFYKTASEIGFQDIIKHFRDEQGPTKKWRPLSETTKSMRKQTDPKILQDSGDLRGSIMPIFTNRKAEIGTNLNYGKLHQEGGTVAFKGKNRKVPARPFIWISDSASDRILKFFMLELKRI